MTGRDLIETGLVDGEGVAVPRVDPLRSTHAAQCHNPPAMLPPSSASPLINQAPCEMNPANAAMRQAHLLVEVDDGDGEPRLERDHGHGGPADIPCGQSLELSGLHPLICDEQTRGYVGDLTHWEGAARRIS